MRQRDWDDVRPDAGVPQPPRPDGGRPASGPRYRPRDVDGYGRAEPDGTPHREPQGHGRREPDGPRPRDRGDYDPRRDQAGRDPRQALGPSGRAYGGRPDEDEMR